MINNINFKQEILREINHLLIAILPISYFFLDKSILLYFLVPICSSIILIDYFRHKSDKIAVIFNKLFSKILRSDNTNKLSGASYFSIAALIIFIFFDKIIAINAFLILAIPCSLAAIIGRSTQTRPFFEKSLAGSMAFFISALIIVIILGLIFKEEILYYLFALIAIFVTTIIEARPKLLNIDNNFIIPISFSLSLITFNTIWIYN